MAVAKKLFNPIAIIAGIGFNIILIAATLLIVLPLTPFVLLYWLFLLGIGNLKSVGYISRGKQLLKDDKADMTTLDASIQRLLGVDKGGRKDSAAWVREERRRTVANELIAMRRKSFPNDKIHYLS